MGKIICKFRGFFKCRLIATVARKARTVEMRPMELTGEMFDK